jgi:hypothetical protein
MAEPDDVIVPILRNIQTNITRLEGKIDDNGEKLLDVSERVEAMQGLMHYHLGMTTEQQHPIASIQKQIKELEKRVAVLEDTQQ